MRYYSVVITDPKTGAVINPSSLGGLGITSLLPTGGTNSSALNIEFDIPVYAFHAPDGQAWVRIWGLSIADLGAAFNLNPTTANGTDGALISISGGMSPGLPLANPAQRGPLVKGQVIQAFGNWVGTSQTVDILMAAPSGGSAPGPVNYSLNWTAGVPLADALKTTLAAALPSAKININVSPRLTMSHDQPAYYGSLSQLNKFLQPLSQSIVTDSGYQGVFITYDGTTVNAYDGTDTTNQKKVLIAFQDMLGQPTWIAPNIIQIKCVLRGDLDIGDMVTLPPSLVTSTSAAFQGLSGNNPANNLTFTGPYIIQKIHHYGNFRQPDALSWNTTVDMAKVPSS